MCVDHLMICKCGMNSASLTFRDEIMPAEVIGKIYCPHCSTGVSYDPGTMLKDNGWVIAYDMDIAEFASRKLPAAKITPEFLFDEGYCTWRGIYPMDHMDSVRERGELLELSKTDKKRYIEEFRNWSTSRMKRLAEEGWRKANAD